MSCGVLQGRWLCPMRCVCVWRADDSIIDGVSCVYATKSRTLEMGDAAIVNTHDACSLTNSSARCTGLKVLKQVYNMRAVALSLRQPRVTAVQHTVCPEPTG